MNTKKHVYFGIVFWNRAENGISGTGEMHIRGKIPFVSIRSKGRKSEDIS